MAGDYFKAAATSIVNQRRDSMASREEGSHCWLPHVVGKYRREAGYRANATQPMLLPMPRSQHQRAANAPIHTPDVILYY